MDAESIAAAPGGPGLRAGGHSEELGDGVGVPSRGGERDEPGVGGQVVGHGISLGVVVGFVGEEEDGWRGKNKTMAQMPAEDLLEGLRAVLALPRDGFVKGGHYAPPKNITFNALGLASAPAASVERISQ